MLNGMVISLDRLLNLGKEEEPRITYYLGISNDPKTHLPWEFTSETNARATRDILQEMTVVERVSVFTGVVDHPVVMANERLLKIFRRNPK